jgi:FAD/FMN-containing dehydrogenase
LSTDWSVPIEALDELLEWTGSALEPLGLEGAYAYGHIGNGHPHLNLLCPDAQTKTRVTEVLHEQLQRVVAVGGSPVSEHGIGKVKRDLVAPHLPRGMVSALRGLKSHFDPDGLLAPGNLINIKSS